MRTYSIYVRVVDVSEIERVGFLMQKQQVRKFPTPEAIGRLGVSFRHKEFRDRLGGQALVKIG